MYEPAQLAGRALAPSTVVWGWGGNRALDRAGFAIASSCLRQCLTSPDGLDESDRAVMEKPFLTLA